MHVNSIGERDADPGVKHEAELLFAPYSVFTVESVDWSDRPFVRPHSVCLLVANDNKKEREDLPLAAWL